jgi:vancomycin resistance protein YoaR
LLYVLIFVLSLIIGTAAIGIYRYEQNFKNRIYKGVKVDGIIFGGQTKSDVENFFRSKNRQLSNLRIILTLENAAATISASDLGFSFDEKLSADQAYLIGRSGNILSDTLSKWQAYTKGLNLKSMLKLNTAPIDESINYLKSAVDIPAQDALFDFSNGKVLAFKPSKPGKILNTEKTKDIVMMYVNSAAFQNSEVGPIILSPVIEEQNPSITTENSNSYGIRELVGIGTSKFLGSIPGRVHNIELASSKLHGKLIAPGETFSFNENLGDVSQATGFQPAYIIKEGRTVLGDGGGVCQVSTTLYRAALNAGLPIIERHAHAYRVSYYEQDSGPGLDATVFAPSVDMKFKNDTEHHLLIQAKFNRNNLTLAFEIFGTKDGRKITLSKPVIYSQTPPPPDLYQDDPTLAKGIVKQVDWKAYGAKTSFTYKVERNGETLIDETVYSNYKPWQAIFLKGTRE